MTYSEEKIRKMLPKAYLRKHVAHEISVAVTHFKYLVPVMDRYVYNEGTAKDLMSLTGTIQVSYMDKTYNIPVCLWLEESYPQTAPICYVRPTREMMVVPRVFVSSNGEVMMPYLTEWKSGECDLVSLLQVMCATFGEAPPVCMRPHQEPEPITCWQQFQRQPQVLSNSDGSMSLHLPNEEGQFFPHKNETNC